MAGDTWREGDLRQEQARRSDGAGARGRASTIREATQAGQTGSGPRSILRLPSALSTDWQIERELPSRGAEADLLLVANNAADRRVAKIYRSGIEPKTEVLQQVGGSSFDHVVRLFDHGRSDGRWYELLEYVEHGSLEDLIHQEGPKPGEPRVREILLEIADAIDHLHSHDVVHRDIKPSNILVRTSKPLDLVLTDFGIASILGQGSRRFTTGNRTIAYAAPETSAGEISKATDWWSLGIILVEILTGRHPFSGVSPGELLDDRAIMSRLVQMPVDQLVEGTAGPWKTLCRGLLRREAKNRWGNGEIQRWLRGDTTLRVVEEVATARPEHPPFFFAGKKYSALPEIAQAFGQNWPEARKVVERGHLFNWVKDDLRDNEWRQFLSDLDRDCGDPDERLFRIIVKLDPNGTPTFCGYALDPDGLKRLATDASSGAGESVAIIQNIFDRQIFDIAAKLTRVGQYSELNTALTSSLADYRRFCDAAARSGARTPSIPNDRSFPRSDILRSLLPGGDSFVASLRKRANEAATKDALDCPWFSELAAARNRFVAASLLVPLVANAAESETRERRQREDLERRQRHYDETYQLYCNVSGGSAGALGGLAAGFVPCWIITGALSSLWGSAAGWGWFWFLMIGCSVAGMVLGAGVARDKSWVASASRDSAETRTTGLLISVPSLFLIGCLTMYWISLASNGPRQDGFFAEQERRNQAHRQQQEAIERQKLIYAETNTSASCPGRVVEVTETEQWRDVNPNSCAIGWNVSEGRLIVKYMYPWLSWEIWPGGFEQGLQGVKEVRAKNGTARWRFILCANNTPRFTEILKQGRWSCS